MKRKIGVVVVALFFVALSAAFLFTPMGVFAQGEENLLWGGQKNTVQNATGLGNLDIRIVIANVIRIFLGFLGIIAVLLIMYAGWLWITSEGDESKIILAKKTLKNSIVGLVIIMGSFGIVSFIMSAFFGALVGGIGTKQPGGGQVGLGATGNGVISSHYPVRDQKDVPRNTKLVITFVESIDPSTIILDVSNGGAPDGIWGNWVDANGDGVMDDGEYDKVNSANVQLFKTADAGMGINVDTLFARVTPDKKIFSFKQVPPYIGSPSVKVMYSVKLTNDIKTEKGLTIFGTAGQYTWDFEASTIIDITPPKIKSIVPFPDMTEPRNVVVQVNFDEAVDPISASGDSLDMKNIIVVDEGVVPVVEVEGNYYISNEYRTIEYLSKDQCGVNTCGKEIYCLPGLTNISVLVKSANLAAPPEPTATYDTLSTYPYDGVVDMADNSFDGNGNGIAEGPGFSTPYDANNPDASNGDSYRWDFDTTAEIRKDAPVIDSVSPGIGASDVGITEDLRATFDTMIMSRSLQQEVSCFLHTDNVSDEVYYWMTTDNLLSGNGVVTFRHAAFVSATEYIPILNSDVVDIYQNCFRPSGGPASPGTCVTDPDANLNYCCDGSLQTNKCN